MGNIKDRKDKRELSFKDFREVDAAAPEGSKFSDFAYAWKNNGIRPDGSRMTMKDALAMWESPLYIPKVINNTVQEAVEPLLIATKMLERVPYTPGTLIDLPVFGASDGNFDVGEGENYPELRITYGGGSQIAMTGKQGVALRFTEEILRYSQYNVIDMNVRQAGYALARFKEQKIFNMWYDLGETTHDNADPANSNWGTTTGRDMTGAQNGTPTMDDIFEMYATILANGGNPDMILVHPLTWLMFIQDAQLRAFAQMNQSAFFGSQWSGNPARNDFESYRGGMGASGFESRHYPAEAQVNAGGLGDPASIANFSHNLNSAPVLPNYFGVPIRVVVSSFVPYNAADNTTTILMADSRQLGFYIEDEALGSSEWKEPESDITRIKLKERYVIRGKNRGKGLAVMKNVVVGANQIILPAQTTISIAGSVDALDRTVAI